MSSYEHYSASSIKNFTKIKSNPNTLQFKKQNKICLSPKNEINKISAFMPNKLENSSKVSRKIPFSPVNNCEHLDFTGQKPKKETYLAKSSKNTPLSMFHKKF